MTEFTTDWFDNNRPIFEQIRSALGDDLGPLHAVEIGSFEGKSTLWFLDNLLTHPESGIVCIDTWQGGVEHKDMNLTEVERRFDENTKPYGNKVIKLKTASSRGLVHLLYHSYRADIVYVDGSHQAKDVLSDLVLVHQLVRPGGLVVCDDYLWTMESQNPLDTPKMAIDAFMLCYQRELQPLHNLSNRVMAWLKK